MSANPPSFRSLKHRFGKFLCFFWVVYKFFLFFFWYFWFSLDFLWIFISFFVVVVLYCFVMIVLVLRTSGEFFNGFIGFNSGFYPVILFYRVIF